MVIPPAFTNTNFPCENLPLSVGPDDGWNLELSCIDGPGFAPLVRIKIIGGVPPYVVLTSMGEAAVITVPNIYEIRIDRAVKGLLGSYAGYNGAFCNAVNDIPFGKDPDDPTYDMYVDTFPGNGYAFARLGLALLDKGIFADCRHHCQALMYDCFGRPAAQPTVGQNYFVIDPNDCPLSEIDPTGNPAFNSPGRGLGRCVNAHDYDLSYRYPSVYWMIGGDPADYGDCGEGKITGGVTLDPAEVAAFEAAQASILDIRHPNLISKGCTPCALVKGMNVAVTVTDSIGSAIMTTIPIL